MAGRHEGAPAVYVRRVWGGWPWLVAYRLSGMACRTRVAGGQFVLFSRPTVVRYTLQNPAGLQL